VLEEFGGGDGSAVAATGVLDVSDVTLDLLGVLFAERETPVFFAGGFCAAKNFSQVGSSLEKAPTLIIPRATTQAPVRVAASIK